MKYKYFIAYSFKKGYAGGQGNCEYVSSTLINGGDIIHNVEKDIVASIGVDSIAILNYILMSTEEGDK